MKVKHGDKFYTAEHTCGFSYHPKEKIIDGQESTYITYKWVTPVYVYSINHIYDGSKSFDICPVDVNHASPGANWHWRRSHVEADIGKNLFRTEREAWDKYYEHTGDKEHQATLLKRELQFVQENDPDLMYKGLPRRKDEAKIHHLS
jgi:hypothetical protein